MKGALKAIAIMHKSLSFQRREFVSIENEKKMLLHPSTSSILHPVDPCASDACIVMHCTFYHMSWISILDIAFTPLYVHIKNKEKERIKKIERAATYRFMVRK